MYNLDYFPLEKKIISRKNRFKLKNKDLKELKKDFFNSTVLITGASGSIGSIFVKNLKIFNFKKLFLLDKDENQLTELNRELLLEFSTKQINKTFFICSDLTLINIKDYIKKNKITHYLNFAAIKHVRSEERLDSIKYMFLTNSKNFLINFDNKKIKTNLKKVFSISTDKTVNPTSILGVSKLIMEQKLSEFKKINKKIFVSSVKFANVSFSNGSILKYIFDRINQKRVFGIPQNIKRFFITHEEASSLCLKSLLLRNDGHILIPSKNVINKIMSIKDLCFSILKYKNYNPIFSTRKKINNKILAKGSKNYTVLINKLKTHGQKEYEELVSKEEKIYADEYDDTIIKIKFKNFMNTNQFIKDIENCKNIKNLKLEISKIIKSYKPTKKVSMVSKII